MKKRKTFRKFVALVLVMTLMVALSPISASAADYDGDHRLSETELDVMSYYGLNRENFLVDGAERCNMTIYSLNKKNKLKKLSLHPSGLYVLKSGTTYVLELDTSLPLQEDMKECWLSVYYSRQNAPGVPNLACASLITDGGETYVWFAGFLGNNLKIAPLKKGNPYAKKCKKMTAKKYYFTITTTNKKEYKWDRFDATGPNNLKVHVDYIGLVAEKKKK